MPRAFTMPKHAPSLLLAILCALLPDMAAWAGPPEHTEQAVKAAFVFNFAKFTEWPAEIFASPETPFTLCVLGEESFNALRDSSVGKQIHGRVLRVHDKVNSESVGDCQILFISALENMSDKELSALLSARHVLTVSDRENFAAVGGIIGLFTEGGQIKFEINLQAAGRADLKLGSQLLRLARIVNTTRLP